MSPLPEKDKKFSAEELAEFHGAAGKPVYIAYQGKIFDVSESEFWEGGEHMASHQAGRDLTAELAAAPHGPEMLERLLQVGTLKPEEAAPREVPRALAGLLRRWPLLKRHPHPMVVHFPLVFSISATFFNLLYLGTGDKSYELTGLHCLGGALLFIPLAILTGLFTWWLNYRSELVKPVVIKMTLSPILFLAALATFLWRLANPDILAPVRGSGFIYLALILLLTPLAAIIGWYGGTLSFPIKEELAAARD